MDGQPQCFVTPHHSPKNVKQKNRSSQFLSKFNCPWKASILPSPSFCCTQSGFLQTRQTCCLFRTFSRPPLSFSASLSSFIECTLPAKKHNCFCHIITELFYSHVQIGILLGVYMPSNWNYERGGMNKHVCYFGRMKYLLCCGRVIYFILHSPLCSCRYDKLLTVPAVYANYQCVFATCAIISGNNPPWSGVGAGALLARIKDFSWQRIMRVLIVLQDIYHSPLLNCKGHRQTKTKQYPPNHGGEILNGSF